MLFQIPYEDTTSKGQQTSTTKTTTTTIAEYFIENSFLRDRQKTLGEEFQKYSTTNPIDDYDALENSFDFQPNVSEHFNKSKIVIERQVQKIVPEKSSNHFTLVLDNVESEDDDDINKFENNRTEDRIPGKIKHFIKFKPAEKPPESSKDSEITETTTKQFQKQNIVLKSTGQLRDRQTDSPNLTSFNTYAKPQKVKQLLHKNITRSNLTNLSDVKELLPEKDHKEVRKRRQVFPTPYILAVFLNLYLYPNIASYCSIFQTSGSAAVQAQISSDSLAACSAGCAAGCNLPRVPDLYDCNLVSACISSVVDVPYPDISACIAQMQLTLNFIVNLNCPPLTPDVPPVTTTTSTTPSYFVPGIILIGGTVAVAAPAVAASAILLTPPLPLVTPQVSISTTFLRFYQKARPLFKCKKKYL